MRAIKLTLSSIIFILFITLCTQKEMDYSTAKNISVKWELISNFTERPEVFSARFVFDNHSDLILSSNWKLFFNISPRTIVEPTTEQKATVEHLNGDWYQLIPNQDFILNKGDSLQIHYYGQGGLNKESDGPLGVYFVFYNEKGIEQEIVPVDCKILPFRTEQQINRSESDEEPIPTPQYRYENNKELTVLSTDKHLKIIPSPISVARIGTSCVIDSDWSIIHDEGLESEASILAEKLKEINSIDLQINNNSAKKQIHLSIANISVNGTSTEAYELSMTADKIQITGSDAAGTFYGIQSLLAMVPLKARQQKSESFEMECVQIKDAPRFHFRGLHTDLGRNFQTKETILKTLDIMSFYKVNKYLFYMTEDEGWRLEIPGLPELTEVGAERKHTSSYHDPVLHPAYGSGPFAYSEGSHGSGYITRADFIEILNYAAARHIQVIPEVNFPGHARSSIKAMEARYKSLMAAGKEKEANEYRLIDPDEKSVYLSAQCYKDNIVSVARSSTYRFYKKVMDEVSLMYEDAGLKLTDIHTGGDEVPEGSWSDSPLAAEVMKQNPQYKDSRNLQAYFFKRLLNTLKDDGYNIHGWEEVALIKNEQGGYDPNPEFVGKNVIPYVWNNLSGNQDLAYRIANAGYDVVLCPVSAFYFDLAYDKDPKEPGLYWAGFVRTRDAWSFAPFDLFKTTVQESNGREIDIESEYEGMERLKPEAKRRILGLEAQLWSETIKGQEMFEYYMLPKLVGFAETAWAKERNWESNENKKSREQEMQKQWNTFANSLAGQELPRLKYLNSGYNYRIPLPGAVIDDGKLLANIEFPGLDIRYTTDGSEPDENSEPYTSPIKATEVIKLKAFDKSGKSSRTVTVNKNMPDQILML